MATGVSVVTGAASGIGRELARRLAAMGHVVVGTDVNEAGLAETRDGAMAAEGRLHVRAHDVRDAAAWAALIADVEAQHGPLTHLFNVAGVLRVGHVWDVTPADVDLHVDVNVKGVMYGTAAAVTAMRPHARGHIVNVASLAGLAAVPGLTLYSGSKFAVRGFSLAAARELTALGIALTVVCPDAVETPMLDIQVDRPEARLTFSGDRSLTVTEVVDAIVTTVMHDRPLEIALPPSRGTLAKVSSLVPGLSAKLMPYLLRRGEARQRAARGGRG